MARLADGALGVRRGGPRLGEERLPGRGEPDALGKPLQQRTADLALERLDLLRQRRLRDVEARRGAGERALVGDRGKVAELAEVDRQSL